MAIKNVTITEFFFFPRHFPERPIMPGVLMIEVIMCLISSIFVMLSLPFN